MARLKLMQFLLGGAAMGAIALPGVGFAQEDANVEIIVTAQKKAENIQDVPLAVTALSGALVENKVIDDALDLQFSVPNLFFNGDRATLRGIGNLAISSTSEGGLGYHVNGVYFNSPSSEQEYFDVERIEVLRGPQGTLYGRNTTGGVINIITKRPSDAFEGFANATIGNYQSLKLRGAVNIPLGEAAATRFAGFYLTRGGYTTNIFNGEDIDDRDMYGLRSTTEINFGANTSATIILSRFEEDDRRATLTKGVCTKDPLTGCSPLSAGFGTPDSRTTIFNTLGILTGTLPGSFAAGVDYFAGAVNPTDLRVVNQDVDPTYRALEESATLEVSHDFGALSLTSLTSYQRIKRDILNDFDRNVATVSLLRPVTFAALGQGAITTSNIVSARRDVTSGTQFLQELRLASDFAGAFNFVVGANYYDFEGNIDVIITHPTLAARQQQRVFSSRFEAFLIESHPSTTESYGVFGEGYLSLSEATKLTLGLRYSDDSKSILTRQIFLDPLADGSVRPFTSAQGSWGVTTGRIVVDHNFTDTVMGYASYSRGYKAGGLNPGGPAGGLTFDPEYVDAIEAGLKSTLFDGAVRANLAGFHYKYDGLQIGQVAPTSAITVNADAEIYGAEAEFTWTPNANWLLDLTLSKLKTEITQFTSGDEGDPNAIAPGAVIVRDAAGNPVRTPGGVTIKNLSGNSLPDSPEWKLSFGAQYTIDLGALELTPRVDFYVQDEFYGTAFNKPSDTFNGYNQIDVKALLTPKDGPWQLRAFVKNLEDNADIVRITQEGPLVGRFRSLVVLEPRTYGVELNIDF